MSIGRLPKAFWDKLRAWYSVANVAHVATIFMVGVVLTGTWAALDFFMMTRESYLQKDVNQVRTYAADTILEELERLNLSVDSLPGMYWVTMGYKLYPVPQIELTTPSWRSMPWIAPETQEPLLVPQAIDFDEDILQSLPEREKDYVINTLPEATEYPSSLPLYLANILSDYQVEKDELAKVVGSLEEAEAWVVNVKIRNEGNVESGPVELRIVRQEPKITISGTKNLNLEDGRLRATSIGPGAEVEVTLTSTSEIDLAKDIDIDLEDRESSFTNKMVVLRWIGIAFAVAILFAFFDILKRGTPTES